MTDFPAFRFVTIQRPAPGALIVRWALQPHSWPLADLRFALYRASSPAGPWELQAEVEQGGWSWTDFNVFGSGVSRPYYYVVRCLSLTGKGYCDSAPTKHGPEADNIALEMIRKKLTYLYVKGGMLAAVFCVKTWGTNCSRCYNYERQEPTDDNCPDCFGTGYSGGYLNPVYVPALMNPPQRAIVSAGLVYETDTPFMEFGNTPELRPDDLVVNCLQNIRYRVKHVAPTTHRMALVAQMVSLVRVDENDIVYTLPIKVPPNASIGRGWDLITRDEPHEALQNVPLSSP
jgi:hypothetical protein